MTYRTLQKLWFSKLYSSQPLGSKMNSPKDYTQVGAAPQPERPRSNAVSQTSEHQNTLKKCHSAENPPRGGTCPVGSWAYHTGEDSMILKRLWALRKASLTSCSFLHCCCSPSLLESERRTTKVHRLAEPARFSHVDLTVSMLAS